jgi:integrase
MLGKGRYLARYRGPDHKERSKLCPTIKAAKDWLASERAKMVVGEWVDPVLKRTTFGEFAVPWLDRRGTREDRTVELYAYLLKNHILPKFGNRSFDSIRPSLIQEWHSDLWKRHPSTSAKAYRLLAQIMRAAVEDGYLAKSPCRVKGAGEERPAERPTASIAEAEALALAMPERLRLIVHLALWCQLRRGELLGLRRGDMNPLLQTVTIRETRVRLMSGEVVAK